MSYVRLAILGAAILGSAVQVGRADDLLYRYEGDVLPYDPSAGWVPRGCDYPCSEYLEDGHFVVRWEAGGLLSSYLYRITVPPHEDPPSLWVEWSFRSSQALGPVWFSCDGRFSVHYAKITDGINTYGDAAIGFSGDDYVLGLDISQFHTYRFESPDGAHYAFSVDGTVFMTGADTGSNGYSNLLFASEGGCGGEAFPKVNAWDFIRYGTLSLGEEVVGSEPPEGFLDAREALFARILVSYAAPNYVYVDEVSAISRPFTVDTPIVIATKRLDNGAPELVELVLDRHLPYRATTRFILDDGVAQNVLEFTFAEGDTDGDGDADLADFARLDACAAESPMTSGPCLALDANEDFAIDLADYYDFMTAMAGP